MSAKTYDIVGLKLYIVSDVVGAYHIRCRMSSCEHTMSYVLYDIVYFYYFAQKLRHRMYISYVWHTMSYVSSCGLYTMLYVGQKSDACGGDVVGRWYRQKRKYYIIVTQHLDSCLDNFIVWCYWDSNREPIDSKWQLDRYAKEPSHLPCSQCVNDGICLVFYLSGICCQWNRWKHAKCHVQAYEM